MPNEYIAVTYATYNLRNIIIATIVIFMYYFFITNLCIAIKYEILNKREECDVRYYYSRACRNKIANSILMDPAFLNYKKKYFENVNTNITPHLDTAMVFMDAGESKINVDETAHANYTNKAKTDLLSQFKPVSDALYSTIGSFLGSLRGVLDNVKRSDSPGVDFSNSLTALQTKISESIPPEYISDELQPSLAKMISPLQKLWGGLGF